MKSQTIQETGICLIFKTNNLRKFCEKKISRRSIILQRTDTIYLNVGYQFLVLLRNFGINSDANFVSIQKK